MADACIRCGRPLPPVDADEYLHWEDQGDDWICPGCITQEELTERAEFAAGDEEE